MSGLIRRAMRAAVGAAVVAALALFGAGASAGAASTPLWLLHVQRYPGGISNGVRAQATSEVAALQAGYGAGTAAAGGGGLTDGPNVQMNDDTNPPVPQNETTVAYNLTNSMIAVAGSNDYVSGGTAVMRTSDGGRHWSTTRVVAWFKGSGDTCSGGDPSISYSRRDKAFYLAQLCFFRTTPYSEVNIYKSVDNGRTWTPGRLSATAATNFDYTDETVDASVFHDKEYIAVDNNPGSPHYGRLYVTWTKFHLLASGKSDYCPINLAYTDRVPTANPAEAKFRHTRVQPDAPGAHGVGMSANQFSDPQVEKDGSLDIGFISEDCNDSYDPHLLFQKSTNGGRSFLPHAVQIDKPGQYRDFLNRAKDDTLPPTAFRAPNTISVDYSATTGTLTYVYQNNINRPTSRADISYQQSRDGGRHWSSMRFLSTAGRDQPAVNDQFFPWVDSDQAGTIYAIWFDRRLDPRNRDIDTWQGVSRDDGRSWASQRISTRSWNPDKGFFSSGAFIGDYNGIAASTHAVYPVWTDGRNSAFDRTGTGETDIFTNVEIR